MKRLNEGENGKNLFVSLFGFVFVFQTYLFHTHIICARKRGEVALPFK